MPNPHPVHKIDNNSIPPEERRAKARRAGLQSAKVRRDKRTVRERLGALLELDMVDGKGNLLRSPITGEYMSVGEAIDTAMISKAVKGDVKAANAIYDILNIKQIRAEVTGAEGEALIPPSKMSDDELAKKIAEITIKMQK